MLLTMWEETSEKHVDIFLNIWLDLNHMAWEKNTTWIVIEMYLETNQRQIYQ